MRYIPNAITRTVGRQVLLGRKHSPTVLFAAGVVGSVASTVLACRATLKLEQVITEAEKQIGLANEYTSASYSEQDRSHDVVIIKVRCAAKIAKLYTPAVAVGILSVTALTSSNRILTKRNMALTAAYAALEKGFAEYRQRVVDEIGEDKERELRYYETRETVDEKGKKTTTKVPTPWGGSIYARFFDETCKSWSPNHEYNIITLKAKQNYLNDMLHARGHVFLNEVYDEFGMERSKAGSIVGWIISKEGDNYIDFGVFNPDNERARAFVNGQEAGIMLDFNVDGVIYEKI